MGNKKPNVSACCHSYKESHLYIAERFSFIAKRFDKILHKLHKLHKLLIST